MNNLVLEELADKALDVGLLLRLKVSRPLNLWALRLVVADYLEPNKVRILGEMKAWAYNATNGLQLDTMRVNPEAPQGVGDLVWAATMAWALAETPCKSARLLAIRDDERQHELLVRYFSQRGFEVARDIGAAPKDLPLRIIWGGSGMLMIADCRKVFERSLRRWQKS